MRIGDLAPDFSLIDHDGITRQLSTALADGPIVLFFYPAAMTPGCTKEACHFRDTGAEFTALGAQRWGISMDDSDAQSLFASTNSLDYPLLIDAGGAVARQYGVKRPLNLLKVKRTTFVIARDQRIIDVIASEFNMETHVERALVALRS